MPGRDAHGQAGVLLMDGTAEEHLRIGALALEDAGDAGAPLELHKHSALASANRSVFWSPRKALTLTCRARRC